VADGHITYVDLSIEDSCRPFDEDHAAIPTSDAPWSRP